MSVSLFVMAKNTAYFSSLILLTCADRSIDAIKNEKRKKEKEKINIYIHIYLNAF